jgi:hypothetical protein
MALSLFKQKCLTLPTMASKEVTGTDSEGLHKMEGEHYQSRFYENRGVAFEVAYCLAPIGKQPDDYNGPQRFCRRRATKRDDWDGDPYAEGAYGSSCLFHGGAVFDKEENRNNPLTAGISHGAYSDDKHLKMDFNDQEQALYDSIMDEWPDIYNWPSRAEDPARYRILRRVAVNEVRSVREEDYIDEEGEVHVKEIPTENGVQTEEVENPVSREYRLLMKEITGQLKELGLTPKQRQKMDTLSSQADKDDAISDIAGDALGGDAEYDPNQFDDQE